MKRYIGLVVLLLAWPMFAPAQAQELLQAIEVRDDEGTLVSLPEPARRIISLSPHLAENVYSAGAGKALVATVEFSDYPRKARKLPRIGGYKTIDVERIVSMKPDLVLAWGSGNGPFLIEHLRKLGLVVFVSEPVELDDVPSLIERLGILAGTSRSAQDVAQLYRQTIHGIKQHYRKKRKVSVFYQVWDRPLITINGEHMISDVIQLCGGHNVFSEQKVLAPQVSREAVIKANPEVIVASSEIEKRPEWLDNWRKWKNIRAVKQGHVYTLPADIIQRQTLRLLQGTTRLCGLLDKARKKSARL